MGRRARRASSSTEWYKSDDYIASWVTARQDTDCTASRTLPRIKNAAKPTSLKPFNDSLKRWLIAYLKLKKER